MKKIVVICCMLLQCTGCISRPKPAIEEIVEQESIINLDSSATIIKNLIASNQLSNILEGTDPEQEDTLIKNFSPAVLALEVEVLSQNDPVLVVVHDHDDSRLMQIIYDYAARHPDRKVIYINGEKFFKITEDLKIDNFPAVIVIQDREEKRRIEGSLTPEALEELWL